MPTISRPFSSLLSKEIIPFVLTGGVLILVGFFLVSQSLIGELLPHDVESLGMTGAQLSVFNNGKILKFMYHDRIAFGGSLISLGILYIWLATGPLKNGEPWAWWLFLVSGILGFGSFLTYIGYGYLDLWHLFGTICLLPIFILGLYYAYVRIKPAGSLQSLLIRKMDLSLHTLPGLGNYCFLITSLGLFIGGSVIMIVGMTMVFVPQDLDFMQIKTCGLTQINARLVPIIAHDRASFGGGIATTGITFFFIIWCSEFSKALWRVVALAISCGFIAAIGVHFWISYLDFWHLAPAYFGLILFYTGLWLTRPKVGAGLKPGQ